MCAVTLKSDKETKHLPLSSTIVIDMTNNIKIGKTDYKTYQLNVENNACIGGPKCRYNGKEIHYFFAHLQTLALKVAY